ncbi:microcin C ABC transporter permease YejB [Leisingera sp. M527]|uniref:microcin C ABC transporter permease YejB n=1 Tax=unclassified Leisingera TaxID=2614906 RepID=UPI001012D2C9|nr:MULTISPECIES: microcin C ABC transporter permease YejB [unclassified Leisingera]MBQ4827276.1 microcin C ABC transporter permease YejB [Leisingera sp. HS039]MCF6432555.1 microcin C ABC transporter permease YejB [Leisingera sp. MMG026]QAX28498.1 microcin C ABC transporter permease YejB [Leisingera sp. NJS204]QBR37521.1 microcin C ABC transporter permease YejB [Leisingera sp. NJS201]UWQ28082.1 microcin C ABC transporter permease YejB [Leisingera sp. M523]
MAAYIFRRLLLVIPTLFGILLVNFALVQFVPGGPVEQIIAQLEGGGDVFEGFAGGGGDTGTEAISANENYAGRQGLPPELIEELQQQFGLDKPPLERFLTMLGNYARFDFGESYFRKIDVTDLVLEKMPVSISLGLWSTLIAYMISIPMGIRKALRDGSRFDTWTSGFIIAAYAIPSFLFAIMLLVLFAGGSYWQIFPLRGLTSDNWDQLSLIGKIGDYAWHIALPVLASTIGAFATLTLLTKNSFLDEIKKQYVMTARAKGLSENRVLYGHVFRNAMLIVIAGFPSVFIGVFFSGSLIIETIFSLDGLGRLGFEAAVARDYPVIFGTLFIFGLMSLVVGIVSDLMYVLVDPRIDFDKREG